MKQDKESAYLSPDFGRNSASRSSIENYYSPDTLFHQKNQNADHFSDSEFPLPQEYQNYLNHLTIPKYDESSPYRKLQQTPSAPFTQGQRTPVCKPSAPEVLPPKAQYEVWTDLTDVIFKKEASLLSSWSRKTAVITRQTISVFKDSKTHQRIQPEFDIRLQDIKSIKGVDPLKVKDKISTAFTITTKDGEYIFHAETIASKDHWFRKIYTAILLYCSHGGNCPQLLQEAFKIGVNVNIAETKERIPCLAMAVENNRKELVRDLISLGAHPQYLVHKSFLSKVGFSRVFQVMIESQADLNVRGVDSYAGTLLHHACEAQDAAAVRVMLSCDPRVNLNIRNGDGDTPLMICLKMRNSSLARMMIEAGADVHVVDRHHRYPIHLAIMGGMSEIVVLMEQQGADLSAVDDGENSPLHLTISKGMISTTFYLIFCGASIYGANKYGETPLHLSLKGGSKMTKVSAFLIQHGSRLDAVDHYSVTPYLISISSGQWDLALFLTLFDSKGSGVNITNRNGDSPLLLASRCLKKQLIFQLLDCGADPNISNSIGETPLYVFLDNYCYDVDLEGDGAPYHLSSCIEKFVFKNADFKLPKMKNQYTALHIAVEKNLVAAVDLFLQLDPDCVSQSTLQKETALHLAISSQPGDLNCQLAIASLLLGAGVALNQVNVNGDTALHLAVRLNLKPCVGLLLNFQACPFLWDQSGYFPIHIACVSGFVDILEDFLDFYPAHLNVVTEKGETCIMLAVLHDRPSVIDKLVSAGASVAIRCPETHDTALHVAVEGGREECVRELLRAPIQVRSVVNKRGESAIHVCERKIRETRLDRFTELYEMLCGPAKILGLRRKNVSVNLADEGAGGGSDDGGYDYEREGLKGRERVEEGVGRYLGGKNRRRSKGKERGRGATLSMDFDFGGLVVGDGLNPVGDDSGGREIQSESEKGTQKGGATGGKRRSLTEQSFDSLEVWMDRNRVTGALREKIKKDSQKLGACLSDLDEFVLLVEKSRRENMAPPKNLHYSRMYENIRSILLISGRLERLLFQPTACEIIRKMVKIIEKLIESNHNKHLCQQSCEPPFVQKTLDLIQKSLSESEYRFWIGLGVSWNSAVG